MDKKQQFLNLIQSNIDQHGFHITVVNGGIEPRYAYTIGLCKLFNFELIFAGGVRYLYHDVSQIINEAVEELKKGQPLNELKISVGSLGTFSFVNVDVSWSNLMALGVLDYYQIDEITAFQIIPDKNNYTLDIPDMANAFDVTKEPVWQWLTREWYYAAPAKSIVATNLDALQGEPVTEVTRWEDEEWEMFAGPGPDVKKEDMRVVSLGTMLGIDATLLPTVNLRIGEGLWRETGDSGWNNWE